MNQELNAIGSIVSDTRFNRYSPSDSALSR
jgi:hypothetical protein